MQNQEQLKSMVVILVYDSKYSLADDFGTQCPVRFTFRLKYHCPVLLRSKIMVKLVAPIH